MNERTFFNPHMAQTLVSLQLLLYLDAAMTLLFSLGALGGVGLLGILVMAGAAYGIANERKWGYALAIVAVAYLLGTLLWYALVWGSIADLFGFPLITEVIFRVVLAVLVFHPQSREYQRIWFK